MAIQVQSPSSSSSSPIDFDFDFNNGRGSESPWLSTPSSPERFGSFFFSTPNSPARANYDDYNSNLKFRGISTDSDTNLNTNLLQSPPTERIVISKKKSSLWSAFSPARKKPPKIPNPNPNVAVERGRVLTSSSSTLKSSKREARSLSPERQRWRLKDLLLFRSASEGRGSEKDPLKKYSGNNKNRSANKRAGPGASPSPHELHYKANKAFSEDLRKRSFLPYKQGILGRLAVNHTVHTLAHGFGSLAPTNGHL